MRRRTSLDSLEEHSESSTANARRMSQTQVVRPKASTDRLSSYESLNGLVSPHPSPLWGEPGRKLPSVSSMLQMPPLTLTPQSSGTALTNDIEDLAKDEKQREDLLIEELSKATPRVSLEISSQDKLCIKCRMPGKLMLETMKAI